jgi:hypothetical protein
LGRSWDHALKVGIIELVNCYATGFSEPVEVYFAQVGGEHFVMASDAAPTQTDAIHTIRMLTWVIGIMLGIASVAGAIFLRDLAFSIANSYTTYLPSLYFIALNTSIIALAECFGLAFFVKRDQHQNVVRLFVQFIALLILVFADFILYAKSVFRLSIQNVQTDWLDVSTPLIIILLAGIVISSMKNTLSKLQG